MGRPEKCYIDGRKCTGARFYFCDDCLKAIRGRDYEKHPPISPLVNTLNHIPDKEDRPMKYAINFVDSTVQTFTTPEEREACMDRLRANGLYLNEDYTLADIPDDMKGE